MIERMCKCRVCGQNHKVTIGDDNPHRTALLVEDVQHVGVILDAREHAALKDHSGGGDIIRDILRLQGIDLSKPYFYEVFDQCPDKNPTVYYWQPQDWPEEVAV